MQNAFCMKVDIDDIKLDEQVPHIELKPHAWRGLQTIGSLRQIPLVGASLSAAKRIKQTNTISPCRFGSATGVSAISC